MTEISMGDFPFYPGKKIRLYTYIFNRNLYSLICFERETCLRGIILPEISPYYSTSLFP